MKLRPLPLAAAVLLVACQPATDDTPDSGALETTARADAALAELLVYKSPTCGCCDGWVDHLREEGFTVETRDVANPNVVKTDVGLPARLASCHTAIVDGYVVEGHVPAEAVRKLLEERPQIAGLAVPGMPIGSPGMEGPNPEPYVVYAFDRAGNTTEFMRVDPR